jgi:hypothetical protein
MGEVKMKTLGRPESAQEKISDQPKKGLDPKTD